VWGWGLPHRSALLSPSHFFLPSPRPSPFSTSCFFTPPSHVLPPPRPSMSESTPAAFRAPGLPAEAASGRMDGNPAPYYGTVVLVRPRPRQPAQYGTGGRGLVDGVALDARPSGPCVRTPRARPDGPARPGEPGSRAGLHSRYANGPGPVARWPHYKHNNTIHITRRRAPWAGRGGGALPAPRLRGLGPRCRRHARRRRRRPRHPAGRARTGPDAGEPRRLPVRPLSLCPSLPLPRLNFPAPFPSEPSEPSE
jgi:hypothetical protein